MKLIFLSGGEYWSCWQVENHFNMSHPNRDTVTLSAVTKVVRNFKLTDSVNYKSCCD